MSYSPLAQQIPIGNLDQRVIFEQDTSELVQGEHRPSWEVVTTVWANVIESTGTESGELERETAFGKATFTIRYNATLTNEAMRILWNGDYYDVTHVKTIARNRFMIIEAQRTR